MMIYKSYQGVILTTLVYIVLNFGGFHSLSNEQKNKNTDFQYKIKPSTVKNKYKKK